MTEQLEGQMNIFDLGLWSGKMSPEPSIPEPQREKTSESSLKKSPKSSTKMPQFLDLRTANGRTPDVSFSMGGPLLGEYTMRSFGESPISVQAECRTNWEHRSGVGESRLSQILEDMPHPKYCLSARAALGILNRAEKRAKELPERLRKALERQAQSVSKNEPESQGGGKGILIQDDKIASLSTSNNQNVCAPEHDVVCIGNGQTAQLREQEVVGTLNCMHDQQAICYGISAYDSNSMKSSNPNSGIYEAETARTLDLNGGSPTCNQGGMAVVQEPVCFRKKGHPQNSEQGQGWEETEVNDTLNIFDNSENRTPTIVIEGNGSRPSHQGPGYSESDVMFTLNATEHHAVGVDMYNQCETGQVSKTLNAVKSDSDHVPCVLNGWDVQSKHIQPEDGVAETLYSGECRYGGGESYVLAKEAERIVQTMCIGNGQLHDAMNPDVEVSKTLNCLDDPMKIVTYGLDRASFNQGANAQYDFSIIEETAPTLVSKGPGGGY